MGIRFVGLPRALVLSRMVEEEPWRDFADRIFTEAKRLCPVAPEEEGWQGPHLVDTLRMKLIGGEDPRILIGSQERGEVLDFVHNGTEPHVIEPVNARALRFSSGGTIVFATSVQHPGTTANPFVLDAARNILNGR